MKYFLAVDAKGNYISNNGWCTVLREDGTEATPLKRKRWYHGALHFFEKSFPVFASRLYE